MGREKKDLSNREGHAIGIVNTMMITWKPCESNTLPPDKSYATTSSGRGDNDVSLPPASLGIAIIYGFAYQTSRKQTAPTTPTS